MYTNSDQLTAGKLGEIKYKIQLHKPLIVAICEVKPKNKSEIKASEYNILGYTLYPVNLENDTGQGIAVFVKNKFFNLFNRVKIQGGRFVRDKAKGRRLSFFFVHIS